MALIRPSSLQEANDFLQYKMSEAEMTGRIDDAEFCQVIARTALVLHVPELLGIVGRSVEIEAAQCEALTPDGITRFDEVAYRAAYRGALVVKRQEQAIMSGSVLTTYAFTIQSTQTVDRATDPALTTSDHIFVDFSNVDGIKVKAA